MLCLNIEFTSPYFWTYWSKKQLLDISSRMTKSTTSTLDYFFHFGYVGSMASGFIALLFFRQKVLGGLFLGCGVVSSLASGTERILFAAKLVCLKCFSWWEICALQGCVYQWVHVLSCIIILSFGIKLLTWQKNIKYKSKLQAVHVVL